MKVELPEHFTLSQRVCADYIELYIQKLSEDWFASTWMNEMDLELYSDVVNNKPKYFESYIMNNLKYCSDNIGGWIAWDDDISAPRYYNHVQIKVLIESIIEKRNKVN